MNNGRMKESLSGTAAIEDIEEATFIAFREFGYHGRYKTLSRGDEGNSDDLSADGKDLKRVRRPIHLPEYLTRDIDQIEPKANQSKPEPEPQTDHTCDRLRLSSTRPSRSYFSCQPDPEPQPEYSHTCESRANELKKMFRSYSRLSLLIGYAKSIETESIEARRWAQFKSIRFTEKAALPSSNPDFLTHAKVYVFGTRYLIDSLREKALKSLHRDLCEFQFGSQTVSRILDQLEYAFQNTGRQEPDRYYSLRMMVIECRIQGKVFD
jgi:hypothetical protein